MSFRISLLGLFLLVSCASTREPASEYKTWKQADEQVERAEFMNRSR